MRMVKLLLASTGLVSLIALGSAPAAEAAGHTVKLSGTRFEMQVPKDWAPGYKDLDNLLMLHFGNADAYIPNEGVDAVGAAIAGREGFFLNVEDAGHAFDNHESEMFWNEAAAKSAWAKTMSFLTEHA